MDSDAGTVTRPPNGGDQRRRSRRRARSAPSIVHAGCSYKRTYALLRLMPGATLAVTVVAPSVLHGALMKCSRCQHENPANAKFCLECGVRLTLTCPKCRSELPPSAKFCFECGERIAPAGYDAAGLTSPESYTPKHLAERILN